MCFASKEIIKLKNGLKMKKKLFLPAFAVVLVICVFSIVALGGGLAGNMSKSEKENIFAMDTVMSLQAYGKNAKEANRQVIELIDGLEKSFDTMNEESEVYKLNNKMLSLEDVSTNTKELIELSENCFDITGGAFDIYSYPLSVLWGFETDTLHIPTEEEIGEAKERVQEKEAFSFGGIAKGYVGDLAFDIYKKAGVKSAILNLGGNVVLVGKKPDGTSWNVGIKNPLKQDDVFCVVKGSDVNVVTSGSYERFLVDSDGNKFSHIINPFSGMPADDDLLSVTILAKEGYLADALSTALFVKGLEGSIDFYKNSDAEYEMILFTKDAKIYASEGIIEYLEINGDYPLEIVNN